MESPDQDNKKEIETLMEQVKQLEAENQNLYSSILKFGSKKNKQSLEYYVRLRKDLMLEQSKLVQKLSELELEKAKENEDIEKKMNFLKGKISELNEENKTLKLQIEESNKEHEKKNNIISKRKVELKNEVDKNKIEKLENEVNNLINKLDEKEIMVQGQKEQIDNLQLKIENLNETMGAKISDIQLQYNNLYSASKQNEENFTKLYEDKENNLKDNIQSNKYQLEKKLVQSKNLIDNIQAETSILNNIHLSEMQKKETEINNLKNNLSNINRIYNAFVKLCGDNDEKIKNNIKQMKEIYMEREQQMMDSSKTYVNSMNNYGEAIKEAKNNKNLIDSDLIENQVLIGKLNEKKKKLENEINELSNLKQEIIGENIEGIKSKIKTIEDNITGLNEKQNEFTTEIKKVNDFNIYLKKNNNIMNSLQQSIEKHKKIKENLQNKMTKINIGDDNLENLKNKLKTLQQENLAKDENIKKYEKMFEDVVKNVDMQEEIRTDVLKRLGRQISNYKAQIDKLLESKDNMESLYLNETKSLKETMEFLKQENEELKKESQTLENESEANQKNNELCNQEYKTFKESLKLILDIGSKIPDFDKSVEEIKNTRTELLKDEMVKTKENIKLKNKEIKELKEYICDKTNRTSIKSQSNTLNKKKKVSENELGEIIKNIKLKVKIYNALVDRKQKEVNGLEENIKLIKDYNKFSKKCGENQELLCEENKIMTDEMINDLSGLNEFEQELKGQVEFLNHKIISNKDNHENNVLIINNNTNQQLNNIKERESYIVKQSEQITDGLKKVANQKKNAVDLLKKENQQLKNRNYIINKKL
jgi:chromosome segregation ATPase